MKKTVNFRKKATLLAVAALTSTCFFVGNYTTAYAADGKVIGGQTTGKFANKASGEDSSVSGGFSNTASGPSSSVSGGISNTASGDAGGSSVSGGEFNTASGMASSVSGGDNNTASGSDSSVSGGDNNTASGIASSVSGGSINTASGSGSSVSGGSSNTASGIDSSANGGLFNTAWGDRSSAIGGIMNTAYGSTSLSLGGADSIVQGEFSVGMAGGSTGENATFSVAIGHSSVANVSNSVAIGYQSVASDTQTISFGHKKNDTYYNIQWPEAKDSDGNPIKDSSGNVVYDHTKAPTITEQKYTTDFYSRLVNVADGQDDHDVATVGQLNKKLDADASNVDLDAWAKKLGTGKIASGNTGLVTGGTVYTEVRPAKDGAYVHPTSTTAENLTALDTQVKGNADHISNINTTVNNLNDTVSKLSTTGFSGDMKNQKITNLADGTDDGDAVNKGQMDKADTATLNTAKTYTDSTVSTAKTEAINTAKTYTDSTVSTAKTEAINTAKTYTDSAKAEAIDTAKTYTNNQVSNINNSIKNLQDNDELNVRYTDANKTNVNLNSATIKNLGHGSIDKNSKDAVNGNDVYEYVKSHANGGVEVDDNGNSIVNKNFIVNGDTTVKGNTTLEQTTVNKDFTVKGDTTLEQTTVNKDLTVNGYTTLKDMTTNNVVVNNDLSVNGTTSLQNLNVQGNSQFNQNIAVAGSAVVGHDLAVGGTVSANRVVADDAIIGGESILHRFDEQRNDIDRVGAGAAALAALQYLPYEDGSKLVGGAGYGHYRGRNAGAVGLRYYPNRDVAFSMASTVGNGDTMLNAGVSFRIGSGTGSIHSSADPQKVIQETKALNKALEDRLNKVEQELKASNDVNKELMKRIEALEAKTK